MHTIQMVTPWNVCTPTLFRLLPKNFVDAFFADGSLRLSSFVQFHRHADEQRLDKKEGETMFFHRTFQNGGQSLFAKANHGMNAYVLCASTRCDADLMAAFNCDSYIRILDPTAFGIAIARQIPGFEVGFEGFCLYQEKKIIMKDLGHIDVSRFTDKKALDEFINCQMKHYPLFLKDASFAHQMEYRLLFGVSGNASPYFDIKAPEAVQFCEAPNDMTA